MGVRMKHKVVGYVAGVAIALIFATPTMAAGPRFDLVCRGDAIGTAPVPALRRGGPIKLRIRVDLTAKKFCFDDCGDVRQLTDVNDDFVEASSGEQRVRIMRATGKFLYQRTGLYEAAGAGTCETKPFSGMPKQGF